MDELKEFDNFLHRTDIDLILGGMTARDIFAAIPGGQMVAQGAEVAGSAFEHAAERQGYGKEALDRVRPADAVYLANAIGEVLSQDSPLASDTASSLPSPDTGDLAPSS
jgi:hypothetical protein